MVKSQSLKDYPDFWKYQLPFIAWMIFIFVLSSIPGSTLSHIEFPYAHPIAHALLYSTLYYTAYTAFRHQHISKFLTTYCATSAFVFTALYGASDEYHQSFTPGRTPEFKDFMIDVTAAFVVVAILFVREHLHSQKSG